MSEQAEPSTCLADIDIAILAGGLGTRVRAVLGDTPKLLAPTQGRPYIEHLFTWLSGFGAKRVVLCLGFLADAVREYLKLNPPALDVEIAVEPYPMGTAGAIRFARPLLHSNPVLVCNGDTFVDANLTKFVATHRRMQSQATLLCTEVADAARFGKVEMTQDGWVSSFKEKGESGPGLINGGLYLISSDLLDKIAAGDAVSLEREILAVMPPRNLACHAGLYDFLDIGTPESLVQAKTHRIPGARKLEAQ